MPQHWKWSSSELVTRYQREYSIDVRPYLQVDEITLLRNPESGVWMFQGGRPGDGNFYEQLHGREEYYLEDKWEFGEALRLLSDLPKDAQILEIGCGTGAFLDRCRLAGFHHVSGVELNPRALESCRSKGHDVSDRMIQEWNPSENRFDCICAFQVLEHVPDPIEFLRAASALLRNKGRMILSTPNAESFLSRCKWCLLDLPPHHMSRWDEISYRKTAEFLGMSVVAIKHEPLAPYHYKFYANSLIEHLPRKSFRRLMLKPITRMGFSVYPWKNSITGHSILSVITKQTDNRQAA